VHSKLHHRTLRTPKGIRTPVTAVKGRRPRPLDDGGLITLETSIVAASRYRSPVLKRSVAWCFVLLLAACSGTSGGGSDDGLGNKDACPLLESLDATVAKVAALDPADPGAFDRGMEEAINTYADTIAELQKIVPDDLVPDLERIEAAVRQERFDDAVEERTKLDEYAQTTCGRTIGTVNTSSSTSSTSSTTTTEP
jgi:hypothetical protein